MTIDKNQRYIHLSDVLSAMLGSLTLDLSDPKKEKAFREKAKQEIISEYMKGNLSFYANSGWCIDDMLSILLKKHELRISKN